MELFKGDLFNEVTIRTLDIGGDKIQDYTHIENNPALGLRGIRYSLANMNIFETQLNAIFKVINNKNKKIRILLPMISNLDELDRSLQTIEKIRNNIVAIDIIKNKYTSSSGSLIAARNLTIDKAPIIPKDITSNSHCDCVSNDWK